jgi:acyl transferase domain-containing protein/3-hydroxymyristoyl/3-hydroxydecanoyl-(acyl carrier protein) dehydratase
MPVDTISEPKGAIAIVGVGGLFPGADSLEQFWANIRDRGDATSEVPRSRWLIDPAQAFDPRIAVPDHVYSTRGCFVARPRLDAQDFNLDRSIVERLDPLFHLALYTARQAWSDARTTEVDLRRVGVIFGNIVLPTETAAALSCALLGQAFEDELNKITRIRDCPARGEPADAPGFDAASALNAFPAGLPAAVVARALGLGGVAYTIDAACASSLFALKLAIDELRSGRCDAMLCGGVSCPDSLYTQMGFSQLRALSARGRPAPFDEQADGLVVGEGAGMLVLKRLDDALRLGDHIHGVVAGIGLSNDVHGDLLAPSSAGQLRAMRMAYEQACWSPADIDLVECHAVGTPRGDLVEVESLRSLWGSSGWRKHSCAIGSVKSNIGHALTAAGAAGLIKVLLALKNQLLPPTANFERPAPNLGLGDGPFRILTQAEPWPARAAGQPRRAAVSGFGFGGINAHVLIEEWIPRPRTAPGSRQPAGRRRASERRERVPIAIVGMSAHIGPFDGKPAFQEGALGGDGAIAPEEPRNWWGVHDIGRYAGQGKDAPALAGYFIDSLCFPVKQFRIPPRELAEIMPQQSLMLRVAAESICDSGWDQGLSLRTAVLIGIALDLSAANYHLRWSLAERARQWNSTRGLGLSPEELNRWTQDLRQAAGPPLSANATMGSLGGLIASRIAREFKIGGPCFTVSCDETSGLQALAIAADWLARRELDAAVVGAVDFAGDVRAVLARRFLENVYPAAPSDRHWPPATDDEIAHIACDGAVSLVLKRLDDARRDRDRVYAIVRAASAGLPGIEVDPSANKGIADRTSFLDVTWSGGPLAVGSESTLRALAGCIASDEQTAACGLGSVVGCLGQGGAATGLAAVARAALCLEQQILPEPGADVRRLQRIASRLPAVFVPSGPQYWLRNRAEGPRRALVHVVGIGAVAHSAVLEEFVGGPGAAGREVEPGPRAWEPAQPLGPRGLGLFALEAEDEPGLIARMNELRDLARERPAAPVDALAQAWWQRHPNNARLRLGLAIVADRAGMVEDLLGDLISRSRQRAPGGDWAGGGSIGVYRLDDAAAAPRRLAFVYPGLGSEFAEMGRELSALWPAVLRAQDARTAYLRDQLDPATWWSGERSLRFPDHRAPILANIALGCLVTDLLRDLGLAPDGAIGYSLGETAALIALRAWPDRDLLLRRFQASALFRTELAGPCDAARRLWGIPRPEPVDWFAGIVPRSLEAVRAAIAGRNRVYALIKNTDTETVVGGFRPAVLELGKSLDCSFMELSTVSTVHCEIGRLVAPEYRALHDLETIPPKGIMFYSGARGSPYTVDRPAAADAVTALAHATLDFPTVVKRAYSDGVGIFLEVGPGCSVTRLISRVLGQQPHLARALCPPDRDPSGTILGVLAELIAHRVPVDLAALYGRPMSVDRPRAPAVSSHGRTEEQTVRVAVRGCSFRVPAPPSRAVRPPITIRPDISDFGPVACDSPLMTSSAQIPLTRAFWSTERATADAHQAFLRVANDTSAIIGKLASVQLDLVESAQASRVTSAPRVAFDRAACLEFAVGSIAGVLGPDYAKIDSFPTRVRLPGEPLMLVDRILSIEGPPRSLQPGRVVSEHVIEAGAWYLDGGRIAPSIAMEAGQADLFLCGYLGVDLETQGLAVYRLLDATVTFHRGLPAPGSVIRYDIRITSFFRQGKAILLRFQYDATVAGLPLLSMRDGCAGFFTPEELAAGRGILRRAAETSSRCSRPVSQGHADSLVPMSVTQLSERQVGALRAGDLATAFGPPFDRLALDDPLPLPGARMTLVNRVETLDPTGGACGRGFVRAQADFQPGAWFMVCHFLDDPVMPGTLMYECCLHVLRIFMMRIGWVGRRGQTCYEPVPGISNRLNCRGQVVESTSKVTYEVTVKERGYRPEPYAIADALIFADGKPIVGITDMALQFSGTSRSELERLWAGPTARPAGLAPRFPPAAHR